MVVSPKNMKDYIKDLKQCIKRLYYAEKLLDQYIDRDDNTFLLSLNLEGIGLDTRHPILDYDKNEEECFRYICGDPLQMPVDVSLDNIETIRAMIIKRRNDLREIAGMTSKSRWLGERNYLTTKSVQKRYWTGRLIG
jgi:hypothetical protein